jgi:hypothetical protein
MFVKGCLSHAQNRLCSHAQNMHRVSVEWSFHCLVNGRIEVLVIETGVDLVTGTN